MSQKLTEMLAMLGRGQAADQFLEAIKEVMAAVDATAKKGQATLTLKFTRADDGQLVIASEVKASRPNAAIPPSIFFLDANKNPVRDDPRQEQLFRDDLAARRRGDG